MAVLYETLQWGKNPVKNQYKNSYRDFTSQSHHINFELKCSNDYPDTDNIPQSPQADTYFRRVFFVDKNEKKEQVVESCWGAMPEWKPSHTEKSHRYILQVPLDCEGKEGGGKEAVFAYLASRLGSDFQTVLESRIHGDWFCERSRSGLYFDCKLQFGWLILNNSGFCCIAKCFFMDVDVVKDQIIVYKYFIIIKNSVISLRLNNAI